MVNRKVGRQVRRSSLVVTALAGVALALAACGGGSSTKTSASNGVLRIGISTEALPNPALATVSGLWAATVYDLAYAPLIHLTPDGKLEPSLAASWGYVKGTEVPNTVFQMKLRAGAKFSDGTPVDAAAVAKWLNYFVSAGGSFAAALGTKPVITAVDTSTVRVQLSAPNPSLGVTFSDAGPNIGFVASPAAIANPKLFSSGTYGAGQYVLDKTGSVTGDHYLYKPNPKYYDQSAIKFKSVQVKVISQASSRLQAQQSGQLDVAFGDLTTANAASKAGLKTLSVAQGVVSYTFDLTKNHSQRALQDERVRQAIAHAINRETLAKDLLGGHSQPASAPLFSDTKTGADDYWTYDPALSRKLLEQAGYADGFSFNALVQGAYKGLTGEPLMRAVAQQLQAVGIKMNITSYATDPAYAKDLFDNVAPMFELVPTVSTVPTFYGPWIAKTGVFDFFGGSAALDALYLKGATSVSPEASWAEMIKQFVAKAYMIPIVTDPTLYYVSTKLHGVEVSTVHNTALPTEWEFAK
jgi:peptide/nickel transport system substrate-binding protein